VDASVCLALVLLPAVGFLCGWAFTGVYTSRHYLAAVLGVSLLVSWGVCAGTGGQARRLHRMAVFLWGLVLILQLERVWKAHVQSMDELTVWSALLQEDVPVAVRFPNGFLQSVTLLEGEPEIPVTYLTTDPPEMPALIRGHPHRSLLELIHATGLSASRYDEWVEALDGPGLILELDTLGRPWRRIPVQPPDGTNRSSR
jgi:hypothetical protein